MKFCQNQYCDNPAVKRVPVSENRPSDSTRNFCVACEEAYSIGVQHGEMKASKPRLKFKLAVNLDDDAERWAFMQAQSGKPMRLMPERIGFAGRGSLKAARALWSYALNKHTAVEIRREGRINDAIKYEDICDRIYKQDIQPFIECW